MAFCKLNRAHACAKREEPDRVTRRHPKAMVKGLNKSARIGEEGGTTKVLGAFR